MTSNHRTSFILPSFTVSLLALFSAAGCSGDLEGAERWPFKCTPVDAPEGAATGCDPNRDERTEESKACGMTVYGAPEAVEQTPREAPWIERLIVDATGHFTAPECLYERVRAEYATIETRFPTEGSIGPSSRQKQLALEFDSKGFLNSNHSGVQAFRCLNDRYGMDVVIKRDSAALIRSSGVYHSERLAELYRNISGIESVRVITGSSNLALPSYVICFERRGQQRHYAVAHDTEKVQARYYVGSSGTVCERDAFERSNDSSKPAPAWSSICGDDVWVF